MVQNIPNHRGSKIKRTSRILTDLISQFVMHWYDRRELLLLGSPMSTGGCNASRPVGVDGLYIAIIRAAGNFSSSTTLSAHLPTFHGVNVIIATFGTRSIVFILAHSFVRLVDAIGLGWSVWMKRCRRVVFCTIIAVRYCTASITHWVVEVARWRSARRGLISSRRPLLLAAIRCTGC